MKAKINNFRQGRHTQRSNHMIVTVDGVSDKESAAKYVGRSVVWKSPANKEIKGKVASAHGNSGALRVIFEQGMPGQSRFTDVEIQ